MENDVADLKRHVLALQREVSRISGKLSSIQIVRTAQF